MGSSRYDSLINFESCRWIEALSFPEGLRWHDGRLWFADMYRGEIFSCCLDSKPVLEINWESEVSGIGWLPNGDLLFVDMPNRCIMRRGSEGIACYANASKITRSFCNDMLVDSQGLAYVGEFGFDPRAEPFKTAHLVLAGLDGVARIAAGDLAFPNGMSLTCDGLGLVVAETIGQRLLHFDRNPDSGALSNRRIWAEIPQGSPDGICMDAEDGVWVATVGSPELLRVKDGGEVTHAVKTTAQAYACVLGGVTGTTLFIATTENPQFDDLDQLRSTKNGSIEVVEVDIPAQKYSS